MLRTPDLATASAGQIRQVRDGLWRPIALPISEKTNAKPVSLHPLTFDEAIEAIINVDPDKVGLETNAAPNTDGYRPNDSYTKQKKAQQKSADKDRFR
jgi:hypothetical protein